MVDRSNQKKCSPADPGLHEEGDAHDGADERGEKAGDKPGTQPGKKPHGHVHLLVLGLLQLCSDGNFDQHLAGSKGYWF